MLAWAMMLCFMTQHARMTIPRLTVVKQLNILLVFTDILNRAIPYTRSSISPCYHTSFLVL
jgi:hypothetical protein